MSERYDIQISGDALAAIPRLKDQLGLGRAIARTLDYQNQLTVSVIQAKYMSFPRQGPSTLEGLRVISNRLRGSIRASSALVTAQGVVSAIGSNVVYAAIHEFGYDGPEQVSAHVRHRYSMQSFKFGGRASRHNVRGGDIEVRGFTRQMHMPARAPIQHGIEDRLPEYGPALSDTVMGFWKKGEGGGK